MLRRVLYVGDPHAVPEELDDCRALGQMVFDVAHVANVDAVVFLGDQTHTHAITHVAVLAFWRETFRMFKDAGIRVIALVGNHDRPGTAGSELHTMMVFEDLCEVVAAPRVIDGLLFVPYMDTGEEFLAACRANPTRFVAGHNTFDGSKYENGMYAKDGIDVADIPQEQVLSGHIHTPQRFGKVWYIGAPRWRTLSDANIERAIWVVEHGEDGLVVDSKPFSTGDVCRQIRYMIDTPSTPVPLPLDMRHDWRIDIRGPAAWIEERRPLIKRPGVKVRSFSTDKPTAKVRESDGVDVSLAKFIAGFRPRFGTPASVLHQMARERLRIEVSP
jgi:DNA repair exonuclease SbcCD nuclease subunit